MPARIHPDDLPSCATPMIIAESDTHVTIAFEVSRALLVGYQRLFEQLIAAAEDRHAG